MVNPQGQVDHDGGVRTEWGEAVPRYVQRHGGSSTGPAGRDLPGHGYAARRFEPDRHSDNVIGWFSNTVGYGITYGATDVLSQVEVSYILVAALIAMDTSRQIGWHLANAQHGGATREEAAAVRQIAMEVAEKSGIRWRDGVPELA